MSIGATLWAYDFGDNTAVVSDRSGYHIYKQGGNFSIGPRDCFIRRINNLYPNRQGHGPPGVSALIAAGRMTSGRSGPKPAAPSAASRCLIAVAGRMTSRPSRGRACAARLGIHTGRMPVNIRRSDLDDILPRWQFLVKIR